MSSEPPAYKYFAFISYSRKDSKAAAWLQKRLEWLRFPVKLVPEDRRPPNSKYVRPVYRDKTNLDVTDEHYWTNIRQALEESRFLIVLCSPFSARSVPVNMEVEYFLEKHGGDSSLVVPVIVSGNVRKRDESEALCPALLELRDAKGDLLTDHNLSTMIPDAGSSYAGELDAWETAFTGIASYLLGLKREAMGDHIQRETQRQKRNLRRWVLATSLLTAAAFVAGAYAFVQKFYAEDLLWEASYSSHEAAMQAIEKDIRPEGLAHFERAFRYMPRNTSSLKASALAAFSSPLWQTRCHFVMDGQIQCSSTSSHTALAAVGIKGQENNKGEIVLIDPIAGRVLRKVEIDSVPSLISFSPKGSILAIATENHQVRLIEVLTGRETVAASFPEGITSVCFSPDGKHLVASCAHRTSKLIETKTGRQIHVFESEENVTSARFSPDGSQLILALGDSDADRSAIVLDPATVEKMRDVAMSHQVTHVDLSPDGGLIIAGDFTGISSIIDSKSGADTISAGISGDVETASFSNDHCFIAIGTKDGFLTIVDLRTDAELKVKLDANVIHTAFSSDALHVAVSTENQAVCVIHRITGEIVGNFQSAAPITAVHFSEDSTYLMAVSEDKTVKIFQSGSSFQGDKAASKNSDLITCEVTKLASKEAGTRITFRASGKVTVARDFAIAEDVVVLERGEHGRQIGVATLKEFPSTLPGAEPLKRYVRVRILDMATGAETAKLELNGPALSVAASRDCRYVAYSGEDQTTRLIEVATGEEKARFEFENRQAGNTYFSPNGHFIVVTSRSLHGAATTIDIVDVSSGQKVHQSIIPVEISDVCFSPDAAHFVITGSSPENVENNQFTHYFFESAKGKWVGKTQTNGPDVGNLISEKWLSPEDPNAAPAWSAALRIHSGLQLGPTGQLRPMDKSQLLADQKLVNEFTSVSPSRGEQWQHAILKWVASVPIERTTTPWTQQPLRTAAGRSLMQEVAGSPFIVISPTKSAPWHPLGPIAIARVEQKYAESRMEDSEIRPPEHHLEILFGRPRYLARLSLKRIKQADEHLYGRYTLAEYAWWCAKIMHEELKLDAEAREAIAFALERTPPDKQKELLELKAKLSP